MGTDTRYNGWTNYATWRVNLEIFDGIDLEYFTDEIGTGDVYALSKRLEEFADNVISAYARAFLADVNFYEDGTVEGAAVDYARAFLADVNFYEIAKHLVDAHGRSAPVEVEALRSALGNIEQALGLGHSRADKGAA